VGEWSMSMSFEQDVGSTDFLAEQLKAFEASYGWYYWNFKLNTTGHDVWSFEKLLTEGYDFGLLQ